MGLAKSLDEDTLTEDATSNEHRPSGRRSCG
jgi:hypothetical protein